MNINTLFDFNLYLVGLSGTGKSTCGRLLSDKLRLTFIDLDKEISKTEKVPIPQIFELKGEQYFRTLETSILEFFSENTKQVVATGGGIVENYSNIQIMKNTGKMVWLKASPVQISKRLSFKYADPRPLLGDFPDVTTISKMLKRRQHLYSEAELAIDTNKNSPSQIVTILSKFLQH